jgi:hypothetical protein
VRLCGKLLVAVLAPKRPLLGVRHHVPLQGGLANELCAAFRARVSLFIRVDHDVVTQSIGRSEAFFANVTAVGFLPTVYSLVRRKV